MERVRAIVAGQDTHLVGCSRVRFRSACWRAIVERANLFASHIGCRRGLSMDIVVDSNIFYGRYSLKGPPFDRLFDGLYASLGRLCIPEVVVAEVANLYGEYLQRLASREAQLPPGFEGDVESHVTNYHDSFINFIQRYGRILPYPQVPHQCVVERDLKGRKPFKRNGSGYRDYLIWESVLDLVRAGSRDVALITNNHKDFGKGPAVHPDLQADLVDPARVQLFPTLQAFNEEVVRPRMDKLNEANALAMTDLSRWMRGAMIAELEGVDVLAGQGEDRIRPVRLIDWHAVQVEQLDATGDEIRRIRLRVSADVQFWIEGRYDWIARRRGPKDALGRPPAEIFSPSGKSRLERIDIEMEFEVYRNCDMLIAGELLLLESPFHEPFRWQQEHACSGRVS